MTPKTGRETQDGALLVAMLVVCRVCAESGRVGESRWLAGHMGFVWVHADSFLRCVASPFHSFVTTYFHVHHDFTRTTLVVCGGFGSSNLKPALTSFQVLMAQ